MQQIDNLNVEHLQRVYKRLKRNTKNFNTLMVRDPVDFLDFEINLTKNLEDLILEINRSSYHPQKPYTHLSPKNKGINRPTVVFDIRDALVYRFCIEEIEDILLKKTKQKGVFGGIKITPNLDSEGDPYEKWIKEWRNYIVSIENALESSNFLVSTDIASYFEFINLLILKDLLRSDVDGKYGLLNLLFYFLENSRFRLDYEVNTFNGLPQEDIDCSRLLAYYFLNRNDKKMALFSKQNHCEFYRWVDDMSVIVKSEVEGRKALKKLTESLRELGLVASIEKTSILNNELAKEEFFFKENRLLDEYEAKIIKLIVNPSRNRIAINGLKRNLEKYYVSLVKSGKTSKKAWIKILKRFYTLLSYLQSDLLLNEVSQHLISYPLVIFGRKLSKYFIRNQQSPLFSQALYKLILYLKSDENLYPMIETEVLEIFLYLNQKYMTPQIKSKISFLSEDIFFKKNNFKPLSDYARALACLLIFRFNKNKLEGLANYYIKSNEYSFILRKYLIFVSLTVENEKLRKLVFNKAQKEQNPIISRMVNLIENMFLYKSKRELKIYLRKNRVYIHKAKVFEYYTPIRTEILDKLIEIWS